MPTKNTMRKALENVAVFLETGQTKGAVYEVSRPPLSVGKIRKELRMSQHKFAETFLFSVRTVQNWEQDLREPEGPARAYLIAIKHNPQAVREAIEKERAEYKIIEITDASAKSGRTATATAHGM